MANKRMFSLDIVASDAFLDMPTSSRELYFQLGMYADDEGFVNPKKIIRMTGASDDDLKVLIGKRFLLPFRSGVVVIKHWLIHNTIRMDRFSPTNYEEEKKGLVIKENKSYTECKPNGNQMATQVKLSKVKLSEIGDKSPTQEFFNSKEKQKEIFDWIVSTGVEESLARNELWEFIKYWKETNPKGKERWQDQKFFDIKRRVGTWLKKVK